jgi:hypothetical protein
MLKSLRTAVTFLSGCVFTVALLVRCGMPPRTADFGGSSASPDGSVAMMTGGDGGLAMMGTDGGNSMMSSDSGLAMMGEDGGGSMMMMNTADALEMSGTRLKARYYKATDGTQQFLGWYDNQLHLNCSFSKASDGNIHCLPTMGGLSYFSDSACNASIAVSYTCDTPRYAASTSGTAVCPQQTGIYSVGSRISLPHFYSKSGTTCSDAGPTSTYEAQGWSFYSLGGAVPASTFVQATEMME